MVSLEGIRSDLSESILFLIEKNILFSYKNKFLCKKLDFLCFSSFFFPNYFQSAATLWILRNASERSPQDLEEAILTLLAPCEGIFKLRYTLLVLFAAELRATVEPLGNMWAWCLRRAYGGEPSMGEPLSH